MGTFTVPIDIAGLTQTEFFHSEALVDTGATHSVLPGKFLRKLNVDPIEKIPFELADDRTIEFEIGQARIRLDGRERVALVIFGPDDSSPLLGATTLDIFNLAVDPVGKKLIPVHGLLK